jgi:hypothetical protein
MAVLARTFWSRQEGACFFLNSDLEIAALLELEGGLNSSTLAVDIVSLRPKLDLERPEALLEEAARVR